VIVGRRRTTLGPLDAVPPAAEPDGAARYAASAQ